ncbi:hypothetical protein V8G54_028605, partial [Vigna mungo]
LHVLISESLCLLVDTITGESLLNNDIKQKIAFGNQLLHMNFFLNNNITLGISKPSKTKKYHSWTSFQKNIHRQLFLILTFPLGVKLSKYLQYQPSSVYKNFHGYLCQEKVKGKIVILDTNVYIKQFT